jgi:predicted signal transduction protein with EAL and GGDEF domain
MENPAIHDIELYPPESFKTLLDHEVNMSRRYGDSLTLIDFVVETEPASPETQHSAEVFAINVLNLHLRETDIPCHKGNEFLILMPSTAAPGARNACERLRDLMTLTPHELDRVSFKLSAYIGMATLPNDRSVTSDGLAQNASRALEHARTNQIPGVVAFSEIRQ